MSKYKGKVMQSPPGYSPAVCAVTCRQTPDGRTFQVEDANDIDCADDGLIICAWFHDCEFDGDPWESARQLVIKYRLQFGHAL